MTGFLAGAVTGGLAVLAGAALALATVPRPACPLPARPQAPQAEPGMIFPPPRETRTALLPPEARP